MLIIPAVDVLDGAVVRLRRGAFDSKTVYRDDPAAQVAEFGSQGASMVHVVDLQGARTGEPSIGLWRAIAASDIPFQAGGGIRDAVVAELVIGSGADRVVVGTAAVWDRKGLGEIVAAVGPERVVAAVDVRDGKALGAAWDDEGRPIADVLAGVASVGIDTVLVTSVVRDGMLSGPDLELLAAVAQSWPEKIIASGGISSLADLAGLDRSGVWATIVGRALYQQEFTLTEAIATVADER